MRYSTTLSPAGTSRSLTLGVRRLAILLLLAAGAIWAGYAYVQEAYLGHKLTQQVSDLHRQNSVIATQNQGYHKDIQALTSGAANEEEARLNGYSRPQERLYLVTATPSPAPPSPSPSPRGSP
jgi:cell division protein FtsB